MASNRRQILRATLTLIVGLLVAVQTAELSGQEAAALSPELASVDRAFAHWDRSALLALSNSDDPSVATIATGCLALLDGDLEAMERLGQDAANSANEAIRTRGEWLLDTAVSWRSVLSHTEVVSKAPFEVRVPAGQADWGRRIDPYLRHLVQATRAEIGIPDKTPARIVILPDLDSLSKIAGVPASKLTASGTVATTLYGRVFLLSPSALQNGYPWHIVLAHEMVHDGCQRRVPGKLPHALEEGLATLLEERAAAGRYRTYSPMERALLFVAAEQGALLTPEELNAPYWDLETGLRARLAFLQALAGALVIQHKGPEQAIRVFFDHLATKEATWLTALKETTKLTERGYQTRLKKRWSSMASREYLPSFLYSDGREWLSPKGKRAVAQATRVVLLADLLWGRGHAEAALTMLLRIADELESTPEITWRLVRLSLELEQFDDALTRVEAALVRHPRDSRTQYAAALVYEALNQTEKAQRAAREAWLLNPFAQQTGELFADGPLISEPAPKEATP